jgi:FkbM family methyltransferase
VTSASWKRRLLAYRGAPAELRRLKRRRAINRARTLPAEWASRYHERVGQPFELVHHRETYVIRVGDRVIGRHIRRQGEWDFDKFELTLQLLDRRSLGTLVDVGANIGTICIPAVARGWAERAIAVEPEPTNHSLLVANAALNGLSERITCVLGAAGPADGEELELELNPTNFGDHRVAGAGDRAAANHVRVASHRLDTIVPSLDSSTDLVWMDVQGFEPAVLRGATRLLAARVPFVLEIHPESLARHGTAAHLVEQLSGYSGYVDLDHPGAGIRPVSELETLVARLASVDGLTDILVR